MEMMIKRLLPLIVSMMILSGCATISGNPRAELIVAQRSFIAVVNSMSTLREAGRLDDEEIENITKLILSGDRLLDMWTGLVLRGVDPANASDVFYHVLGELMSFENRGERDGL